MKEIQFTLNKQDISVQVSPSASFLEVLRNDLRHTGTKEGCGIGECGACTVLVDGVPTHACMLVMSQVEAKSVLTVEGLSQEEIGRTLQACFLNENAVQCGFCTPGMLMSAYALLLKNPNPNEEEIKLAMSGNLCRCTGYVPIINAIKAAAKTI